MTSTMDFDYWICPNIVIHLLSCLEPSKFSVSQDFPVRYFDFYIISILVLPQKEEWAKQILSEWNLSVWSSVSDGVHAALTVSDSSA